MGLVRNTPAEVGCVDSSRVADTATKGVTTASGDLVVDQVLHHDERTAGGKRLVRGTNEVKLSLEVPVVEDQPHGDDVGGRQAFRSIDIIPLAGLVQALLPMR